jgi:hypothetical protein
VKTIHLAHGLDLPLAEAVTQKFAFLARSGAGKTYAAMKLAEELLDGGAQAVIIDVVGVWHGLRAGADGQPGIAIAVFGGDHGDLELSPDAGELVAELVVTRGISIVLDVSSFTGGEQRRFLTAFAETLFHLKKASRSPMHLFLEEAQEMLPQAAGKDSLRLLGAFQRVVKLGRNYGIGITLISQRPQSVHKEVLNQTEALFAGQTNGPQERKTLADWIVDAGGDKKLVDELPGLPRGTMFLWSPQWLGTFKKVEIAKKRTADVSATPMFGGKAAEPRVLAKVDLDQLRGAMASATEEHQANDPTALKRRVAELEKQLAARPKAEPQIVEKHVLSIEEKHQLESLNERLHVCTTELSRIQGSIAHRLDRAHEAAGLGRPIVPNPARTPTTGEPGPTLLVGHKDGALEAPADSVAPPGKIAAIQLAPKKGGVSLGKCEIAILGVLGTRRPQKTTLDQIAILSGYRQSGSFNGAIARLRAEGLIVGRGEAIEITRAGEGQYPGTFTQLPHGKALLHYWQSKLGAAEGKILGVLVWARGSGLSVDEIAEKTGYQQSGSFNGALAKLRKLELISRSTPVTAHPTFFDGGVESARGVLR